ncbi:TetR family transcriptional regulator [Brevibacillus laterosporus]|uniref:TetR/AcrR family transcriptional regulator n=1 Tax=Brevibacillus halotolerans TaxID=1507437 RepID=A0ABT4HTM0_9BACL|nr:MULTISPECIES: TetR/AcrR family transcriptional regulator [Brevibacillus]MCR8984404.1 TetR family transcriptional regulator [Brevibacillus laterosporus]MCZ0830128.1 TetR/AcrR family transcriptional regulator [Brevibacillus halotolerans]
MAKKTGEKYQAIINAAVTVIAKHGYHNAQVSRIAKEAKVADGTIYLYFKNKDDVLISLFNEKMGQFVENCRELTSQAQDVSEKVSILIRSHLSQLAQDHNLAIVTQIELRQINPEVSQGIGEVLKSYFNLIDAVVQEGMDCGIFRSDIDVRMARTMIFGTLDQTVTSWIMKECKYDLVSLVDPIHNLFLKGLCKN